MTVFFLSTCVHVTATVKKILPPPSPGILSRTPLLSGLSVPLLFFSTRSNSPLFSSHLLHRFYFLLPTLLLSFYLAQFLLSCPLYSPVSQSKNNRIKNCPIIGQYSLAKIETWLDFIQYVYERIIYYLDTNQC